jgi:hypothetical protein
LNVSDLYNGKAQLQRKGFWPGKSVEPSELLPVTITATPPAEVERAVCRLRHPSGWVLEFERLPQVAWLHELLAVTV